jgi:hypothetical protein
MSELPILEIPIAVTMLGLTVVDEKSNRRSFRKMHHESAFWWSTELFDLGVFEFARFFRAVLHEDFDTWTPLGGATSNIDGNSDNSSTRLTTNLPMSTTYHQFAFW